jgi:hypothetical protein
MALQPEKRTYDELRHIASYQALYKRLKAELGTRQAKDFPHLLITPKEFDLDQMQDYLCSAEDGDCIEQAGERSTSFVQRSAFPMMRSGTHGLECVGRQAGTPATED